MIPFTVLQAQTDRVADKIEKHVSLSVIYDNFSESPGETKYRLYIADISNDHYNTVQELQAAMERIINPPDDVGVLVEDK